MTDRAERFPWDAHFQSLARNLALANMLPGSWDKSFSREMAAVVAAGCQVGITMKQMASLERLGWKYRRQLPAGLPRDPSKVRAK